MNLTLAVVTTAALLDSINPCAISVLLLTIGFLLSVNSSKKRVLSIAGTYIFGIYLTYISIGLGILSAMTFFGIPHIMTKVGALLLILFGVLNLLETVLPGFPIKMSIPQFIKPRLSRLIYTATYPSFFLLGILVGLFEFPCTGGPYLMILGLLHDKSTVALGAVYLLYYNLIFIFPLVAILLLSANPVVTSRLEKWRHNNSRSLSYLSSIATIILGVVIFML
jgi:cytochrome c-type biogenesis protein